MCFLTTHLHGGTTTRRLSSMPVGLLQLNTPRFRFGSMRCCSRCHQWICWGLYSPEQLDRFFLSCWWIKMVTFMDGKKKLLHSTAAGSTSILNFRAMLQVQTSYGTIHLRNLKQDHLDPGVCCRCSAASVAIMLPCRFTHLFLVPSRLYMYNATVKEDD